MTFRKLILSTIISVTLLGCKKEVSIDKVFTDFSVDKTQIPADGQSSVTLSVKLDENASADRRNVVFATSNGSFGESNKKIVKAEYIDGVLTARASFKISTSVGEVNVSAQPEFDSQQQEFKVTKTLTAVPSIAQTIKLEPSSFGLSSNFLSEVVITGYLRNSSGKFISAGQKVIFEDLLSSGASAGGRFRNILNTTFDSSKVGAVYSAPSYPIGTNIIIRCTLLDTNGNPTNLRDSIILTTNL